MKRLIIIFAVFLPFICKAQQNVFFVDSEEEQPVEEPLRLIVSEGANFPGGYQAMFDFIKNNLLYPQEGFYRKIEGTVFIKTLISESGKLEEISVYQGLGHAFNQEAMRIVKKMPLWEPARYDGKAVKRKLIIPIPFELPKK